MKDYVGQWFEIYRRLDEPTDILFEIEKNGHKEIYRFPHEKTDGVAALFSLAKQLNWQIQNSYQSKSLKKISFFKYFYNCFLFLYWTKTRTQKIWTFDIEKTHDSKLLGSSFCFDEPTTLNLSLTDKKKSLNTVLFHSLNSVLAEAFHFDVSLKSWWMPVNMRPDLGLDTNDSQLQKNYVSNFTIDVNHLMSVEDYQKLITHHLKQQRHWATWWWQHLGKYVSESLLEKIALDNLNKNNYVGAFSNLGEWTSSEHDSVVGFYVNPLRSHPIGASAIIWNGRLKISLRFYPTFPISEQQVESILKNWVQKIKLTSGL